MKKQSKHACGSSAIAGCPTRAEGGYWTSGRPCLIAGSFLLLFYFWPRVLTLSVCIMSHSGLHLPKFALDRLEPSCWESGRSLTRSVRESLKDMKKPQLVNSRNITRKAKAPAE